MIQTLAMVIVLVIVGAVLQTNLATIHTPASLTLPGDASVPVSYFRLLLGLAGAAVLVWLAGLLDLALVHGRLRRRNADVLALEQDLVRYKASSYDQQQPALNDAKARLESTVQELREMIVRVENALRNPPDRATVTEAAAIRADRTLEPEPVGVASRPVPAPEPPGGHEEVGVQPRKRWPL